MASCHTLPGSWDQWLGNGLQNPKMGYFMGSFGFWMSHQPIIKGSAGFPMHEVTSASGVATFHQDY